MAAADVDDSSPLRPGRFPRAWAQFVLWGLTLAVYVTFVDLIAFCRHLESGSFFTPRLFAWGLYFGIQVCNKVPISFRYTVRGLTAVADIVGFLLGLALVALFALQVPVEPRVALALTAAIASWIVFGVIHGLVERGPEIPRSQRIYCAIVAFIIPSAPMVGAGLALAAA